ncbi:hypothetical protein Ahy_B06g079895 isoform C [Arachis hypogaea]|uniref:Uncharacterized protein n=1 Tax=Arachis hypogaea TaxID=3818 RepID=A0A444YGK1_ARAHY|nr:hypothetical protein Ahy_B06g079895 isoform C [Arachis hypogaea]
MVEFSKMRNPCTTCFWMRYLGSMVVITSKALADNFFLLLVAKLMFCVVISGGLIDKLVRFIVMSSIFADGKISYYFMHSIHLNRILKLLYVQSLKYIRKCLSILVQLHKLGWCWHLHPTSDSRFLLDQQACLGYLSILLTVRSSNRKINEFWLMPMTTARSHAVVVAVTVNISSYCYWFHCKVLSRRVCHPYYIAPLV